MLLSEIANDKYSSMSIEQWEKRIKDLQDDIDHAVKQKAAADILKSMRNELDRKVRLLARVKRAKAGVVESVQVDKERKFQTYSEWRAACKKKDPNVWFDGDKDIAQAIVGPKPYKHGETKGIGEWDGLEGVLY